MKFLVVDDFSTMRRIVKNLLSGIGYTDIDMAEDGAPALKMLKQGQYDFVITDWNMPEMTGLELLKAIRADHELRHIPVIMITAEQKREQIVEAAHAGVNGYIVKPFTAGTLQEKIDLVLKRTNK